MSSTSMNTPHLAFRNKRVVVTGAASGIGRRVAELLLEAGAKVIALDRNVVDLPVDQFVTVDFTNPASIAAAAKAIIGEVDVLLNIAGVPGTAAAETTMRVNVLGLRMLTELLVSRINRGGAITNVASIAGAQWQAHLDEVQRLLATPDYDSGVAWWVTTRWMASGPTTFRRSVSWCSPNSTASFCVSMACESTR